MYCALGNRLGHFGFPFVHINFNFTYLLLNIALYRLQYFLQEWFAHQFTKVAHEQH